MEAWIGDAIAKMHIHGIKQSEVAERIGIRRDHLNKILNGHFNPKRNQERVMSAINEIIAERK